MGEETDALVRSFEGAERVETLEARDNPARVVGIAAFGGLARFADGRVVPLRRAGGFGIRNGRAACAGRRAGRSPMATPARFRRGRPPRRPAPSNWLTATLYDLSGATPAWLARGI
ncbi:MAG: hypothetical protein AcusKO_12450 [Acuticoccus sp.]